MFYNKLVVASNVWCCCSVVISKSVSKSVMVIIFGPYHFTLDSWPFHD